MDNFLHIITGFVTDHISNSVSLDERMKSLETSIQRLGSRGNDVEREVALEIQFGRKRKREVVVNWLDRVDTAKAEFESLQQEVGDVKFYSFSRGQLGKRVKRLTEQVASLNEESNFPDGITIDAYEARGVPFPTTDIVLGETFQMNCEEVLGYLKNDQVSSIGIYGMGGVGKTTVMKHVHNQILADPATFGDVCWVTVSQNFSIRRLQNDISRKLNLNLPIEDDEMSRSASLSDILMKMKGRYIVILDDVWVHIPLERVGIPVGGVSLCKVIVTTRSLDVCNKMVCQQKIKISPLSSEEAWGLFMEKLGPNEKLTSEVIQIAKYVARRCGGLPLAIITMAASMRGVTDIHEWRDALEELKKPETFTINGIKSEVLPALKYSYDHLGDDESQMCFLSCALYPEDFLIPRDELIDYCIVKGMIRKRESRRAEIDRSYTIFNKLVKCCLLECGLYGEHVKMHDLIREMALQIMSRKQQVMVKAGLRLMEIPKEEEWSEDLEVVSLIDNNIKEIPDGRSPRCPKLSTLMLQRNYSLTRIPDSFFVQLCSLRVLNLSCNEDLRLLPISIGDLINLNALWLGGCKKLKHIPSLRKLKELRDLDLSDTKVKNIPDGIGELRSLRCLNMNNIEYPCRVDELMELQQLEVFRGRVGDASDYNVLVRSKWFQQLLAYRLLVGEGWGAWGFSLNRSEDWKEIIFMGVSLGGRGTDGVVELPVGGIKRLIIDKCHSMGKYLLEFGLSWKDGRTTELMYIHVHNCKEIEWLVAAPPSSTTIPITSTSRGGGGGDYNQSSFSKLTQLYIINCNKIKVGLPVNCLVHLPVLEILDISNCSGMEEIIRGAREDHENNNGISITIDISLPKLNKLYLHDLPSLRSIYNKGNIICDSIQVINLVHCRKLKRLPLTTTTSCSNGSPRRPFPSLREICIHSSEEEWWESLELVDPTYHPLLRPFLFMLG